MSVSEASFMDNGVDQKHKRYQTPLTNKINHHIQEASSYYGRRW